MKMSTDAFSQLTSLQVQDKTSATAKVEALIEKEWRKRNTEEGQIETEAIRRLEELADQGGEPWATLLLSMCDEEEKRRDAGQEEEGR
jgi:hypothetical protein